MAYIPTGNITIAASPYYGTGGYTYNTATTGTWLGGSSAGVVTVSTSPRPSLQVSGDAEIDGDIKLGGVSLKDTLDKINERLSILVPDPKRLEKYQALKQAYENYKILEALCVEQDNPATTP